MIYTFHHLDPAWKNERVKAIAFDSCPPKSDIYAFGGWLSFASKTPMIKPYFSWIFHPYRMYCGIHAEWEEENQNRMFGDTSVLPRGAHCLFMRGRNDPVLDEDYVTNFIEDVKLHAQPGTNIQEVGSLRLHRTCILYK